MALLFALRMNPLRQHLEQLTRDFLPWAEAVYWFGSSVNGQSHAESDFDLAFIADQGIDSSVRWEASQALARNLGCDVDLVDLRSCSEVMRFQIISTGERLWTNDPAASDAFEALSYSLYQKLNDERRDILADIKSQGRVYK